MGWTGGNGIRGSKEDSCSILIVRIERHSDV